MSNTFRKHDYFPFSANVMMDVSYEWLLWCSAVAAPGSALLLLPGQCRYCHFLTAWALYPPLLQMTPSLHKRHICCNPHGVVCYCSVICVAFPLQFCLFSAKAFALSRWRRTNESDIVKTYQQRQVIGNISIWFLWIWQWGQCAVQEWFINIICCEKAVSSGCGMLVGFLTSLTSKPFFKPFNQFIDAKQHGCAGSPAKPAGLKWSFQQG